MVKKKKKQKSAKESEDVLDSYEKRLAKQPVKSVRGKPGFISEEAEASS